MVTERIVLRFTVIPDFSVEEDRWKVTRIT